MNPDTKVKFNALRGKIAKRYGASSDTETFAATPSVAQTLQDKIVEQADFLQRINVIGVDEVKGEKIIGSANGPVSGRTDTNAGDRQTSDVLNLDTFPFELSKTESDVHIKYATIDSWAKFPDMAARYQRYVRHMMAMDRIRTGFYGTSAAAATNLGVNTNLEDLNKGWFQLVRDDAPAQILVEGVAASGAIKIGPSGDYENVDSAVNDLINLLSDVHHEAGDLVVILGRELISDEKAALYAAQGQTPTEKSKIQDAQVIGTYGGLPAHKVPLFPSRGIMVTSFNNLSIYHQATSWRRKIEDNAKRDRIEDYNTRNEGYVVEDYEKIATVEFGNVKLWNGTAWV